MGIRVLAHRTHRAANIGAFVCLCESERLQAEGESCGCPQEENKVWTSHLLRDEVLMSSQPFDLR